jgi:uncharacterized low-complexity protein
MTGQPDAGDQDRRDRRDRSDPASPGSDILGEFQRWFIRSSAKNMRKEFGGQVRKTFGGGRGNAADIWDTATSEVPPAEGEAPECQWCPICRAARRMRESNPGLSGQLSGAGDAVAAAVHDAIKAFDSLLARTAGPVSEHREGERRDKPGDGKPRDGKPGDGKPRDGKPGDGKPGDGKPGDGKPGDGKPGDGKPGDGKPRGDRPRDGKPRGDRSGAAEWPDGERPGGERHGSPPTQAGEADGPGHEPGDRG